MECFTPMVRFYNIRPPEEENNPDYKAPARIVSRQEVFNNLREDENYLTRIQDKNKLLEEQGSTWRYQLIPCKHCPACQLKYSAEWASRILWETKRHDHNYYITLTYDEEHLPLHEKFNYIDEDGKKTTYENDGTWTGTLQPEDMTRFLKTLRKHFERQGITDIKYFYCGEYGDKPRNIGDRKIMGYRPHYHMILMGAPLDINEFYSWKLDGKTKKLHWKSKQLERWWNKGMIDVAEVEWNCAAYVARYCMKKINTENNPQEYAKVGKIPEFIRMSRRPAIGRTYYEEHKEEIWKNDEVIQKTIKGNTSTFKPPSFCDKLLKEENPELYEQIKESRRNAAERNRQTKKELYKGISDLERLKREAEKTTTKSKMLKRIADFE